MTGTHTFIGKDSSKELEQLEFLKHQPWFKIEQFETTADISMFMSFYESYPYTAIKDDKWAIVIEGMIYNLSDSEIINKCELIADHFVNNKDYLKEIHNFVNQCDGDFIIQIYDKVNGKYLVFNDYDARLPLYFSFDKENLIISRDIKTHLEFTSKIELDLTAIVEFLLIFVTLGDRTYFKGIKKLEPYQCLIVEDITNPKNYLLKNTFSTDYNLYKLKKNKTEILNKLKEQFLIDSKNRVKRLRDAKFDVVTALSGGFDSRAVLGAVSKYDKNIKYFTFEYNNNETKEANQAFNALDKPGEYLKLEYENRLDLNQISELVYKVNGSVDYLTTSICYNDIAALRNHLEDSARIVHFSGDGGEFLRVPVKRFLKSIFYGLENRYYSQITLDECVSVFNNSHLVRGELKNYFQNSYPKEKEAQLKKFNAEYAKMTVYGEERGRMFNWTVHPLWSKGWVKFINEEIPIKWTGYELFIKFLGLIDKRLLNTPIFNRHVLDLTSEKSIKAYESEYQKSFGIKSKVQMIANHYLPFFTDIYRKLRNKQQKQYSASDKEVYRDFMKYYQGLDKFKYVFNLDNVKRHLNGFSGQYNRLTTIAIYLGEIEKRFADKIVQTRK